MNAWPWNRLWVQLSLAFSALVIIAAAVFLFTGFVLRPEPPAAPDERVEAPPPEFRDRAQEFIARTFLTLSVTGGVLGVLAGIWMGRRIALPLEELSRSARAIGAHDLTARAHERGSYEMVSLARSFNQMAADLENAEQLRQNLLSDVAHELRTPLTVLQSNLRAILDDVYELDKAEIASLYEQTRHLSRLVNDLRVLSQAEARQLPLYRQTIDVVELLRDIGEVFEPIAREEDIELTIEMPQSPVLIEADPARITQVVQNLLANALHHTPSGGAVEIALSSPSGVSGHSGDFTSEVTVSVSDTGTGMEPEQLSQVFDRFYRTDRARARDDGGAGLGLAVSRALIEAHGGSITASSQGIGHGSTFVFHIPMTSDSVTQDA